METHQPQPDYNLQLARHTAIFDIGKTNKKLLVFDEVHKIVYEESVQFPETTDEDGFPCEDIDTLVTWLKERLTDSMFAIHQVNFSAYGASWVHLDKEGRRVAPIYNYLKPFPKELAAQFDHLYGLDKVAAETGSPFEGMLNSGLQLYWLKHAKPAQWVKIECSLHFPQYLSYLFTGEKLSDYPSNGCHTMLWDYEKADYHHWVKQEGIDHKLAPLAVGMRPKLIKWRSKELEFGHGIHDSSASLIPYLKASTKPFILLSTGTWCVALNPFWNIKSNRKEADVEELIYMTPTGKRVKATRLFLGNELAEKTRALMEEFGVAESEVHAIRFDQNAFVEVQELKVKPEAVGLRLAYHRLIWQLVQRQVAAIQAARGNSSINQLYINGGFAQNEVFVKMLEDVFHDWQIIISENHEGAALGACMLVNGFKSISNL